MSDYKPIPCRRYEDYELAIMHKARLRLTWEDGNVIYDQVVRPLDLRTAQGEEFLEFRDEQDRARSVRLDRIRRAEPV